MENWNIHRDIYSITRVAIILNCSPATIKRWYRWVSKTNQTIQKVGLPQYTTNSRGTWFFTKEQIKQLQHFKQNLKWGEMAEFNSRYYWSKKKGEAND